MEVTISFHVNGVGRTATTDQDRRLLDVLREDLGLTGTKFGCGEGQCGACTVLVDGRAVRSCLTSVASVQGKEIRTVEGLAAEGSLHPVQQAFIEETAMQCGYCTSGMIMSTVALLQRNAQPSDAEIVSALQGNLCRCNGYLKILDAVHQAARTMRSGG